MNIDQLNTQLEKVRYDYQTDRNIHRIIFPDASPVSVNEFFLVLREILFPETESNGNVKLLIMILGDIPSLNNIQRQATALMRSHPNRAAKTAILFKDQSFLLHLLKTFIQMLKSDATVEFFNLDQEEKAQQWLLDDE